MGTSPFFFRGSKMLNRGLDKLELLRIVEAVANEKSIDKELVIGSMESAIQKAALTKFGNDNNIEVSPRYIGFREYLKIPSVTSFVACSGLKGFTVVSSFLNNRTADTRINKPDKSKKIPRYKEY